VIIAERDLDVESADNAVAVSLTWRHQMRSSDWAR